GAKHKAEIGSLAVKYELERLQRLHTEDELKKKEQQHLYSERKWLDDITALRFRCSELEEENKKNVETIQKLKDENSRLEKEKCNADSEKHLNEMAAVPDPSLSKKRKKGVGHCIGKSSALTPSSIEARTTFQLLSEKAKKGGDSRCTPRYFRGVYDKLSDGKKELINEMGLGAFANLPSYSINHKLLMELVRCYDVFDNTIYTSAGEFMITLKKIGYAFGLNSTGDAFEEKIEDIKDDLNEEEKEALQLFKGKSLKFIGDIVKNNKIDIELEKRTFKRAFGLFIQKSFLCPTSSANISPNQLPVIRDIENIQNRNWAHHEIYFKKKLNNPSAQSPWISYWTGERLREKIKLEAKDPTGLIKKAKMRALREKGEKKKTKKTEGGGN
ncbi:hypothetical protein PIB30_051852, partial [Stylosanthes scabra]|nr:hypothetical protein [Stylosanthes scabra]